MCDSIDIDIERLISPTQSRVVLWNKTSEKYKDKFKTLEVWKTGCREIIDGVTDIHKAGSQDSNINMV